MMRDALAAALHRSQDGHEAAPDLSCCVGRYYAEWAAAVLADPDFREAFERGLAEALYDVNPYGDAGTSVSEAEFLAADTAARLFGETP